jgi:hypothetical protein
MKLSVQSGNFLRLPFRLLPWASWPGGLPLLWPILCLTMCSTAIDRQTWTRAKDKQIGGSGRPSSLDEAGTSAGPRGSVEFRAKPAKQQAHHAKKRTRSAWESNPSPSFTVSSLTMKPGVFAARPPLLPPPSPSRGLGDEAASASADEAPTASWLLGVAICTKFRRVDHALCDFPILTNPPSSDRPPLHPRLKAWQACNSEVLLSFFYLWRTA